MSKLFIFILIYVVLAAAAVWGISRNTQFTFGNWIGLGALFVIFGIFIGYMAVSGSGAPHASFLEWQLPWVPPVPSWWPLLPVRWNIMFALGIPLVVLFALCSLAYHLVPQSALPGFLKDGVVHFYKE